MTEFSVSLLGTCKEAKQGGRMCCWVIQMVALFYVSLTSWQGVGSCALGTELGLALQAALYQAAVPASQQEPCCHNRVPIQVGIGLALKAGVRGQVQAAQPACVLCLFSKAISKLYAHKYHLESERMSIMCGKNPLLPARFPSLI